MSKKCAEMVIDGNHQLACKKVTNLHRVIPQILVAMSRTEIKLKNCISASREDDFCARQQTFTWPILTQKIG